MKKRIICFIILMSALFIRLDVFAMEIETRIVNGVSFEEYIVDHIQRRETQINVLSYDVGVEECVDLYRQVLYKHPELYYVSGTFAYAPRIDFTFDRSTGWSEVVHEDVVGYISLKYLDYEQADEEWVFEQMDKPLSMLDEDMTTVEKILFLHDYLCVNVEYPEENTGKDEYHSILGVVTEGKVVCEGYTKAFQYYMNKLEIPCRVITGHNHAWNEVQIDGEWYMIDVTHDDPTPDEYGKVMHTHFLKSETGIGERRWEVDDYQPCKSTKYDDAFWNDVQTQMIYRDGSWYYVNGNDNDDMNLYSHDFAKHSLTDKGDVCVTLTEKWKNFKTKNSHWVGNYGKIVQYEDKMIYSTPTKIYQCSFDGKNVECIANEMTRNQSIYGMKIEGDHLLYQVAQSPKHEKQKIMISMKRTSMPFGTIIKDAESKASYQVVHSNPAGGTVLYRKSLDRIATSVIVPESIRYDGRNYRVVAISKKAFTNNRKLSDVTLPFTLMREMKCQRQRCHLTKKPLGANYETGRN